MTTPTKTAPPVKKTPPRAEREPTRDETTAAALRALADHVQWHGDTAAEGTVRNLADDLDPPDDDTEDD